VFAPDPEVAQCAQRIVDVYAEAMEGGKGGITVDGQMVDEVTNKMAQEIVENGKATGTLN
jgi:citrate lyase subunit beta/citryl-CoA lyase